MALIVFHYCLMTGVTARKATITASMETQPAVEEEAWAWAKKVRKYRWNAFGAFLNLA